MKTKTLSQTANIETYTPRILALGLLAVLTLLAVTGCQQETPPAAARALAMASPASLCVWMPIRQSVRLRTASTAYTRQGTELTMRWEGAGMTQGNLDGDTFTMNNEGMIFSYHK